MRPTPRSLALYGAALSAGLLALATFPGCTSDSDLDGGSVEPAAGAVGTDEAGGSGTLGQEDPGDGEESLDDDGYLGDSTGSDVGAGEDHGGDSGDGTEGHGVDG
jgi:hypothetical protein